MAHNKLATSDAWRVVGQDQNGQPVQLAKCAGAGAQAMAYAMAGRHLDRGRDVHVTPAR